MRSFGIKICLLIVIWMQPTTAASMSTTASTGQCTTPGLDTCLNGQCGPNLTCNTATNCCESSSGFVCEDTATGCSQYINQCNNPDYTSLLAKNCRKTCNMCGPSCKDLASNCATWATNDFCTNSWYKQQYMTCLCAVTCGVCNAPCN
uniref:ShKT domain-containing protein n=1 Tax=Acrobeloides nanus TaxID=290746 RepID=A0A914ENS5_9BILA